MDTSYKIEAYFTKEHPFQHGISILRDLVNSTELEENYKWGAPVYTI